MELIRIENLCKTYYLGEIDVPVLKGVSLTIERGEMVALMGASGSGKTTLMNILGCLDRPTGGEFWFDGQEMSRLSPNQRALVRTEKIGFVFQSFNLLPRTSAIQNVIMPLDYAPRHASKGEALRLGSLLLDHVGIADRADHEPSQMSGGQQQRVAIGRALVNRPALLLADEPTGNLDSHTSVEILRMFQQLNAEGITVVLVTHDPKVASYASRVVHICDGLIESDEPGGYDPATRAVAPAEGAPAPKSLYGTAKPPASGLSALLPHTLITALKALRRNKMRSILTALGIIIGVAAVIGITEIGQGVASMMKEQIAAMGANILMIHPGAAATGGVSFGAGSVMTLKPEDSDELLRQCPALKDCAPIVRARTQQIVYGNRNWQPDQIMGTTPSYLAIRDWEAMDEGELFTDRDVRSAAKVCLIGVTIKEKLFEGESPVGKDIRINNVNMRVIGVLGRKGANMVGMDQDNVVLAPWTTIKFRVTGSSAVSASAAASATSTINTVSNLYPGQDAVYLAPSAADQANTPQPVRFINVDQIFAQAVSTEETPLAIEQISGVLRERHHLRGEEPDDFNVRDMTEFTTAFSMTGLLMGLLLLIVATFSLIVGGVGIMNIMLVSVTERTREIGLRMAVGARSHHILRQFLIEAIVLCLFGGALGILLGRGAAELVHYWLKWPVAPSIPIILGAVGVSASVGIVFGFYPAWKASRLDPIEALRYE